MQQLGSISKQTGAMLEEREHLQELMKKIEAQIKLETADRYVLALGSYSPKLLKPLVLRHCQPPEASPTRDTLPSRVWK